MTTDRTRNLYLGLIALILTLWAFKAAASVVIPVVLGLFLALVIAPIEKGIRVRLPDWLGWLGLVVAMLTLIGALAGFAGAIWLAASQVSGELSGVQEQISEMMNDDSGITVFGKSLAQISAMVSDRAISEMGKVAETVLSSTGVLLSGFIITFFMVALLLAERSRAALALHNILNGDDQGKLADTIGTAAHKMRVYLLVRLLLGIVTAVVYTLWLWIFGVDLLLTWAILTVLLTFIPNIGSIISGSLPVLYALLTKDPLTVALIAGGLFVIEQVLGNFVDPKVQGRQVTLSPVVVLLGILLWGWLWGIPGTLLATPISIAIVVAAAHWKWAEGVGLLLSNQTEIDDLRDVATGEGR